MKSTNAYKEKWNHDIHNNSRKIHAKWYELRHNNGTFLCIFVFEIKIYLYAMAAIR